MLRLKIKPLLKWSKFCRFASYRTSLMERPNCGQTETPRLNCLTVQQDSGSVEHSGFFSGEDVVLSSNLRPSLQFQLKPVISRIRFTLSNVFGPISRKKI